MRRRKSLEDFVQNVNLSGGKKDTKSISRDTDSKIKPFQDNQGVRACTPSRALKSRKSRCWEGKSHTTGGGQVVTKSDRVGWVPLRHRRIHRLLTTGKVLEQYIGLAAHLGGDGYFVALWQDDSVMDGVPGWR